MTPERWQHLKALLHSALELKPDDRAALLAEACGDDEALREDLVSLLAHEEQARSFIEQPAFGVMAATLTSDQGATMLGSTLGRYRIIALLGSGGMGEVYLAEDTQLGRKIALKTLPAHFTIDDERVRRFQQEARAASALNHPNIITIYEIGQIDSRHFIATEFIEGETLRQRMTKTQMVIGEVLDVATQVAWALSAAHQAGIAHRDIKPGNIMLRPDGVVKVLDFGLAKLTEQKGDDLEAATLINTKQGMVMGTAHYMSPEQARGQKMDARTDIFSLGVVLHEMVTGRVPFAGPTMTDVLASILMLEPPSLSQSAPEAPDELQRIVHNALRKDKEERYKTAAELLTDLKALKQELEFETRRGGYLSSGSGARSAVAANARPETRYARSGGINIPYQVSGDGPIDLVYDSLAILPLFNVSSEPNTEYLSDGITESIINSLSQLPKLRVMAFSTVSRYKDREIDPQEIGRDLKVGAVVMGRVQQLNERLIIGAELVDVTDGSQLWGDHYNRELSDIFAVQEEIAKEITGKLRIKLTGEDRRRLTKRFTENPEAYHAYLKGRFYWNKRTADGYQRGIDHFQQAIEKDPNYALAYTGLSDSYMLFGRFGTVPPRESMPKAKYAATRALEIDDDLAEAHTSLGYIKKEYDWDFQGAEAELKRAIQLNPNYPTAQFWYALYLAETFGRHDEALAKIERAQELEPLSLIMSTDRGMILYLARRYDEAIEQCRKTLEMEPNFFRARLWLGRSFERKGRYQEAIAEFQRARQLDDKPLVLAWLGHAYAASGKRNDARKILDELKQVSKQMYVDSYYIAAIHVALGDKDQAFESLEKAYEERSGWLSRLKVDPIFDGLRSDPRFTNLVQRIGLP